MQTISFLQYLFHQIKVFGPFLIVVPLSTISSWAREFAKWAPELNMLVYNGNSKSRVVIRDHEFFVEGIPEAFNNAIGSGMESEDPKLKFNCLLTTFELALKDQNELGAIRWSYLAVDEAHRLKNSGSQLHEALKDFHTTNRLLITGTPYVTACFNSIDYKILVKTRLLTHLNSQGTPLTNSIPNAPKV